jgi:hypothetical protein
VTFGTAESQLEDAIAGDVEAIASVGQIVAASGALGARYMSGDTSGAWDALTGLGASVRDGAHLSQARAVAWETMRRVRHNLLVVLPRLEAKGYQRAAPGGLGPRRTDEALDEFEEQLGGPLPLSLRMFWRVVGSVDLTQSGRQMVHEWLKKPTSDLQCLGDDDPLVVPDPAELGSEDLAEYGGEEVDETELGANDGRYLVGISADRFQKAQVSGGAGYAVWLPEPCADCRIIGDVCSADERPPAVSPASAARGQWFVRMLRDVQRGGGFRGPVDRAFAGPPGLMPRLPFRALELELAQGLLTI